MKSLDDLFDTRLKGKICWPGPTQAMMLPLVALALHAGGNEREMDPGWALMKKLAQSGNIGRVGVTDTDFSTSLTSGETSVGFYSEPQLTAVAKSFLSWCVSRNSRACRHFSTKAAASPSSRIARTFKPPWHS